MRVNIPTIGQVWVLKEDWTFTLYPEYRNATLWEFFKVEMPPYPKGGGLPPSMEVELPKGTTLIIDRIYLRKGSAEFDSITFRLHGKATERRTATYTPYMYDGTTKVECMPVSYTIPRKPVRFWAKLEDVNNMEVEG